MELEYIAVLEAVGLRALRVRVSPKVPSPTSPAEEADDLRSLQAVFESQVGYQMWKISGRIRKLS